MKFFKCLPRIISKTRCIENCQTCSRRKGDKLLIFFFLHVRNYQSKVLMCFDAKKFRYNEHRCFHSHIFIILKFDSIREINFL
jgi:hypothetical protein